MDLPPGQQKKKFNPFKILLLIPVPWVFVLSFLLGLIPQIFLPIHFHSQGTILIVKIIGLLIFVTGAILAAWSLIIFHKANTTTTPGEISKKLIISGPYRFTRNPMYISLTLAYLGEAGFLIQTWPLFFLPLTIAYVNRIVIPLEEELLKKEFKQDYEIYCKRVKRWI